MRYFSSASSKIFLSWKIMQPGINEPAGEYLGSWSVHDALSTLKPPYKSSDVKQGSRRESSQVYVHML